MQEEGAVEDLTTCTTSSRYRSSGSAGKNVRSCGYMIPLKLAQVMDKNSPKHLQMFQVQAHSKESIHQLMESSILHPLGCVHQNPCELGSIQNIN